MTRAEKRVIRAAMYWFVAQRGWHEDYSDGHYQMVLSSIKELRDACKAVAALTKRRERK